jgi:hypothetical protein
MVLAPAAMPAMAAVTSEEWARGTVSTTDWSNGLRTSLLAAASRHSPRKNIFIASSPQALDPVVRALCGFRGPWQRVEFGPAFAPAVFRLRN